MHKGKVREIGSHQQLLASAGIYWKLYQLQYKDQEIPRPRHWRPNEYSDLGRQRLGRRLTQKLLRSAVTLPKSLQSRTRGDYRVADPSWLALGVVASTAATDAVYVMFNAAVSSRRRLPAATWSSVWYLLSAFADISDTRNWVYVCFAALGSWIGAYVSMTVLGNRAATRRDPEHGGPKTER